uniref:Uncharacterized protein n=1 Tax=viral metagenome TaxID=1070528 RepID=A0A6M3LHW2_9ZZZZ
MGTERRSNCCNAKVREKDGKEICAKCEQVLAKDTIHDVEVKATVKLGLHTKA